MPRASARINGGAATLMWPKLIKAEKNKMKPDEACPEFVGTFVYPKDSPEAARLEDELAKLVEADFPDGEAEESNFKWPIKDGDAFNRKRVKKGKEPYKIFENAIFIAPFMPSEDGTPDLYDGQTLLENRADGAKLFYSGAKAAPLLNIFTYDNKFGAGVSMRLIGVQFFAHGEKQGGSGGGPTNDLLSSGATGTGGSRAGQEDEDKPKPRSRRRFAADDDDADVDFS